MRTGRRSGNGRTGSEFIEDTLRQGRGARANKGASPGFAGVRVSAALGQIQIKRGSAAAASCLLETSAVCSVV